MTIVVDWTQQSLPCCEASDRLCNDLSTASKIYRMSALRCRFSRSSHAFSGEPKSPQAGQAIRPAHHCRCALKWSRPSPLKLLRGWRGASTANRRGTAAADLNGMLGLIVLEILKATWAALLGRIGGVRLDLRLLRLAGFLVRSLLAFGHHCSPAAAATSRRLPRA